MICQFYLGTIQARDEPGPFETGIKVFVISPQLIAAVKQRQGAGSAVPAGKTTMIAP